MFADNIITIYCMYLLYTFYSCMCNIICSDTISSKRLGGTARAAGENDGGGLALVDVTSIGNVANDRMPA